MLYIFFLTAIFLFLIGSLIIFLKKRLSSSFLYKIVPVSDFNATDEQNCIQLSFLDKQSGFMHTSYGWQISDILEKFFKNIDQVLILKLNVYQLKKSGTTVRPEANKLGGTIYPHLYGSQKIPLAAVEQVQIFQKDSFGKFKEKK